MQVNVREAKVEYDVTCQDRTVEGMKMRMIGEEVYIPVMNLRSGFMTSWAPAVSAAQ